MFEPRGTVELHWLGMISVTLTDLVLKGGIVTVLALGAIFDVRYRRIPNALTFGGAIAGCAANLAFHQIVGGVSSIEGWIAGAVVLWIPFALGGMGAGDVKLLAAAGAWGGPEFAFSAAVFSAIAGATVAMVIIILNRRLADTLKPIAFWGRSVMAPLLSAVRPRSRQRGASREPSSINSPVVRTPLKFPYGPALAIGGIAALVLR